MQIMRRGRRRRCVWWGALPVTTGIKILRGAAGVVVVLILLVVVTNWWGDFKTAQRAVPSKETTSTASTSATGAPKSPAKAAPSVVVVMIDGLNFRVSPAGDAKAIRGLAKGDKLTFVSKKGNWYQVKDAKGAVGWVTADSQYTRLQKQ